MSVRGTSRARPDAAPARLAYLPGLDGLRAIAVVAVIVYHANHRWLEGGYLGVEVFFVISGYLITLLLLHEQRRTGTIRLGQFWARRARRLLPALFMVMTLVVVYVAAFYPEAREQSRGDVIAGLFYVSNWYQIWVGQGYGAGEAFAPLRHLWSLAVEEQFYLVWPLVMTAILARRRGRLGDIGIRFMTAAVLVTVVTAFLYRPGVVVACGGEATNGLWFLDERCLNVNEMLYLGSLSRSTGLLLGAGFAMLWRPEMSSRSPIRERSRSFDLLGTLALAGLVVLMSQMHLIRARIYNPWLFRGGFLVVGVLTLVVIAAAVHGRAVTGPLLGNPLFRWIGTRSYGLYLYHWPIFQIIRKQANVLLTPAQFAVAMVITVVVSEASYRVVERPIREGRLVTVIAAARATTARAVAAGTVGAVVVLAIGSHVVADPQCVGAQNCAEEANSASTNTVSPNDPGGGAVAGEPAKFVAIGESVMVGAVRLLRTAGLQVDAEENRGPEGVRATVVRLRDEAGVIGAGTSVVIQVGTNAPLAPDAFAAIMAEIPSDAGTVYFMTLHADVDYIAANNELIRRLPSIYPNVRVIDWDLQAPNTQLCPDGIHITCNGNLPAIFYSNLILSALGQPVIL